MSQNLELRRCLREPIPEIFDAARFLDAAVSAHLQGKKNIAEELFKLAENEAIAEWSYSIAGKFSIYNTPRSTTVELPILPKELRIKARMPTKEEKRSIHARDGYHCRFCGIPVIRSEVWKKAFEIYPFAVRLGRINAEKHIAFSAMCAQYDHILPHSRGGNNDLTNIILTCGPCNYGRGGYTLEQMGLLDPRNYAPISSQWDGLERFQK